MRPMRRLGRRCVKWARENRNRFFEHLLPKAVAAQQRNSIEQRIREEEDIDIAEVERLLVEFSRSVAVGATATERSMA